jgi:hypothetical protein
MRLHLFLNTGRHRSLAMVALAAVCLTLVVGPRDALARTKAKPTIVLVHGALPTPRASAR